MWRITTAHGIALDPVHVVTDPACEPRPNQLCTGSEDCLCGLHSIRRDAVAHAAWGADR